MVHIRARSTCLVRDTVQHDYDLLIVVIMVLGRLVGACRLYCIHVVDAMGAEVGGGKVYYRRESSMMGQSVETITSRVQYMLAEVDGGNNWHRGLGMVGWITETMMNGFQGMLMERDWGIRMDGARCSMMLIPWDRMSMMGGQIAETMTSGVSDMLMEDRGKSSRMDWARCSMIP